MGTTLAIGAIVSTLPPACTVVVVEGVTFQQCGTTWYQPRYQGNQTVYVVVPPPR